MTRATAPPADLAAIVEDERAIVESLLQRECLMGDAPFAPDASHVVIARETDPSLDGYGFTDERPMESWRRAEGMFMFCPVPLAMLNAFAIACHVPSTVVDGIRLPCPVLVAPRADIDDLLADHTTQDWNRLRAEYCSEGYVSLSPVLFDVTRTRALVARAHYSGTMGGGSDLVLFERQPSGWVAVAFLPLSRA